METVETIRVGPAGWNYKDWYGSVYPGNPGKEFKELDYLVQFFDTAEINSTFYRPANAFMADAWVRKASANPRFKFTAKLWQRFTHERSPFGSEEVKQVVLGMDPLARAGKLGALLCQFPWSFKNDEVGRAWLSSILDAFRDYPLVVEIRHSSWDHPAFYESLGKRNVGFAAIDQPVIGRSIALKPIRTGETGYVRLHGRNYEKWFSKAPQAPGAAEQPMRSTSPEASARYDYLYSEKEIKDLADRVKAIAKGSKETYVVQNNHPRGQAAANALQLRAALGETVLKAPPTLVEAFPQIKSIV
ncbi:MAG TPA: DUF72 domain-containing protein, partial [bacterium]